VLETSVTSNLHWCILSELPPFFVKHFLYWPGGLLSYSRKFSSIKLSLGHPQSGFPSQVPNTEISYLEEQLSISALYSVLSLSYQWDSFTRFAYKFHLNFREGRTVRLWTWQGLKLQTCTSWDAASWLLHAWTRYGLVLCLLHACLKTLTCWI